MSERLVPISEVLSLTSLSRSTLYERINEKSFPAPINLGGRRVAWLKSDVDEWIAARIQQTRKGMAG